MKAENITKSRVIEEKKIQIKCASSLIAASCSPRGQLF